MEAENQQGSPVLPVNAEELDRSYSVPAILTNRFVAHVTGSGLRISFGEQSSLEKDTVFRAAVIVSLTDAISLARLIQGLASSADEEVPATQASQPSKTNG
jgi:hypothetical protein